MEYETLIHEFVDGTLPPEREDEFFMMLSSNSDLRMEFKHMLAIREAVKSDKKAFTPAAESTIKIFGALGFNPPPPAAAIVDSKTGGSSAAGKASFMSRYGQGLISGISATVLTLVTVFWLLDFTGSGGITKIAEKPVQEHSTTIFTQEKEPVKANAPVVSSVETDENKTDTKTSRNDLKPRVIIIRDTVFEKMKIPDMADINTDINGTDNSKEYNTLKTTEIKTEPYSNMLSTDYSLPPARIFSEDEKQVQQHEPIGLKLEINGRQDFFGPTRTTPASMAAFNTSSVAISYELFDDIDVGLDIRQENFYQVFTRTEDDGTVVRISQMPNLTTYGVFCRVRPLGYIYSVAPLLQGNVGIDQAGYTGRTMAGIEISPYSGISILLGWEWSRLFYNGNKETSDKRGFVYGLQYKF